MNTYNWNISALDAKIQDGDNSNVIYSVHWRYSAERDRDSENEPRYIAEEIGVLEVTYDPDNFIPYDELTKEDVVGWLTSALNVTEMNERLDANIELQINPVNETLKPDWD